MWRGCSDAARSSSSKCRLFWVRGVCRRGLAPYTVENAMETGALSVGNPANLTSLDVACGCRWLQERSLAGAASPRRSTNSPCDCSHPRLDEDPRRRRRPAQASRPPRAHPRSQARATARLAARRRRTDLGQARTQIHLIRLRRDFPHYDLPLHSLATLTGIATIAPGPVQAITSKHERTPISCCELERGPNSNGDMCDIDPGPASSRDGRG